MSLAGPRISNTRRLRKECDMLNSALVYTD